MDEVRRRSGNRSIHLADWRDDHGNPAIAVIIVLIVLIVGGYFALKHIFPKETIVPVSEDVCTCRDLYEMESRVKETDAAINHINKMIQDQSAIDATKPRAAMYTREQYLQGKGNTHGEVVDARSPGARSGGGDTDANCRSTINTRSECLRQGLQTHENVHIKACREYVDGMEATGQDAAASYQAAQTMIFYWREDVTAYQAEKDYLNRQIAKVKPCKPTVATYDRGPSKEDQKQMLAGIRRRVGNYARTISPRAGA